jgi:hypothetical protein
MAAATCFCLLLKKHNNAAGKTFAAPRAGGQELR